MGWDYEDAADAYYSATPAELEACKREEIHEALHNGIVGELRFPEGRPRWLGTYQDWPCSRCKREVDDSERHRCITI
jgi:hypothetical protein